MLFTLWVLSFVCLEKTRCFVSSNLASVQILKNVHTFLQKKSILAHAFDIDINQRGKSNQSKNQIQEQFHFVLLLKVLWLSEYRQIFCCKYKIYTKETMQRWFSRVWDLTTVSLFTLSTHLVRIGSDRFVFTFLPSALTFPSSLDKRIYPNLERTKGSTLIGK